MFHSNSGVILAIERGMDIDINFPTRLASVDDVPEPFLGTLKDRISSKERIQSLIYSPVFSTLEKNVPPGSTTVTPGQILAPASVLAVLDDRWLVATEEEDGITVEESSFVDTLFLELTSILLSGEFKIYYAAVGTYYAATLLFNTVGEEVYREAIGLILDGIDQKKSTAYNGDDSILRTWPLKFRLEAERYRPKGQRLTTATRWTCLNGELEDTLSPSGALLITERELVFISEQKAFPRQHVGDLHKFGGIITYFPLIRLSDFHINHHGHFGALSLLVRAPHGSEKLEIAFPSDREKAVQKTMQLAMKS
jgi:hypothetical protein